uniref:ubiquitinyl hydrolase 1 n=1 Tax=Timema shepardi TaxID=629360 RepID=A0A7R9AS93_TIMSH|nr:unnamed protein product [Timema shepardi]
MTHGISDTILVPLYKVNGCGGGFSNLAGIALSLEDTTMQAAKIPCFSESTVADKVFFIVSFILFQGANISQLERDIGSDQFPPNEHYFGLVNFGNTCYSNSVLQALYFCKPFRERVLEYKARNKRTKETLLTCLADLFYSIATQKKKVGSIAPKKFIARLRKEKEESRTMTGLWLELSHCSVSAEESRTMTGLWLELSHCFNVCRREQNNDCQHSSGHPCREISELLDRIRQQMFEIGQTEDQATVSFAELV